MKNKTGVLKPLFLSAFWSVMAVSGEAMAFAGVFTGKMKEFQNQLVLFGKAAVGIAVVWGIISIAANRTPNWRWIGTIGAVGVALSGIQQILSFIGVR